MSAGEEVERDNEREGAVLSSSGEGRIVETSPVCSRVYMRAMLPFTARAAVWLEAPALFDAVQVYSPACLAATASIDRTLRRLPFVIEN